MSDPSQDPKVSLSEAVAQVRQAMTALRESVVTAVMRRNRLQDEVVRVERLLADLEEKAALADRIKKPDLANELRAERNLRAKELESLRSALAKAEAEAESAKLRLPEEEARLAQQVNDLRAQYVRQTSVRMETGTSGGPVTEADAMWERATGKLDDLRREASAREEVANASRGLAAGRGYQPAVPGPTPEQSAEAMLAAMEQRLGVTPAEQAPPSPPALGRFLELDDTPSANPAPTVPATPEPLGATNQTAPSPSPRLPLSPSAAGEGRGGVDATMKGSEEDNPKSKIENRKSIRGDRSRMEPTQRVRVAGIGTGGIFRGAHLPCYPEIPQVQLVALCDPDKAAQDLAYKRYQSLVEARIKKASEANDMAAVEQLERDLETVQICDDISEVIETVKPDLVDICTQPFLHTPLSIQALEAGIHVMCEKPISRSWLETQRLTRTIERTGKFYQHNENWLYDRDYYTAKKLVDAGAIGEPILMFLATAHGGPEGNPKFWNPVFGGGGALLDNGIHAIGAAWFVSGFDKVPTLVKAAEPFGMSIRMPERIIEGRYQKVTVEDDAHILIRFENAQTGAWSTAHVEGSWSERDSPDTVIIGTTGKIQFRSEENRRYAVVTDAYDRESRRIEVSGPTWQHWPSSFYGEILNMVESVRNGVPPISGAQFGADCSAIVGASYLSEKNGRRAVTLDEFKRFANDIAARYPNDDKAADDALIEALLSAVRK